MQDLFMLQKKMSQLCQLMVMRLFRLTTKLHCTKLLPTNLVSVAIEVGGSDFQLYSEIVNIFNLYISTYMIEIHATKA